MNLHEYQGKQLFAEYGLPVSRGHAVDTPHEAVEAADLDRRRYVGGQGPGACRRSRQGRRRQAGQEQARDRGLRLTLARSRLVTYQTDAGRTARSKILVESCTDIADELYLGAVVDRSSRRIVFMASTEGGVEIEKVAHETPEKILKATSIPWSAPSPTRGVTSPSSLGLQGEQIKQFVKIFLGLAKMFVDKDLALIEVNPLVITTEGKLHCLDAKIGVDSNALYRQAQLRDMHDPSQEDEREAHAARWELNYVALDGNIGCMVNGAGLAMGTMDIVKLHGGEPANFLDVGGGATKERVSEAFKIILSDDKVKAVLINIFGGIVRCDLIAEGVIGAVQEIGVQVPVVVRLEGNNAELGRKVLADSGLNIIAATSLTDAAQQAVKAAAREVKADEHPDRQEHEGDLPGLHRLPGHLPLGAGHRVRHQMVGGVTPGKGGQEHLGLPVFNTVAEAVDATGADASVIYVPAPFCKDSILEAANGGVKLIVCITEGIPTLDMLEAKVKCDELGVRLIGPNCPGRDHAGGVQDRHHARTHPPAGQGGHRVPLGHPDLRGRQADHGRGLRPVDLRRHRRRPDSRLQLHRHPGLFEADPATEAIVMIGEIGGTAEEEAAAYIKANVSKPVVSYIAGVTAPKGKRMGHAGAIISGGKGTADEKFAALEDAGVRTVRSLADIGAGLSEITGWS
jgi:succinyl-CoA synthetase beta subunit